jgi:stage II sporulation protein AB (anti-sigma F factor)
MDNYMSLKIQALPQNEAFARNVVAAFCVAVNPTVDQINDIKTAVSEAVTNAIVHGYDFKGGAIELNVTLTGRTVHIEVLDEGVGIADIARARTPFFTTRPQDERSGMGFTVMESFMDALEVQNRSDRGVKIVMSKNFDMNRTDEEQVGA